jgi:hypothetical protein
MTAGDEHRDMTPDDGQTFLIGFRILFSCDPVAAMLVPYLWVIAGVGLIVYLVFFQGRDPRPSPQLSKQSVPVSGAPASDSETPARRAVDCPNGTLVYRLKGRDRELETLYDIFSERCLYFN